jgi:hypothetical protein
MTRVHDRQVSKTSRDVHAKESDALWIRMMETLSDDEKIRLDGTIQAFYRNMYLMLTVYTSNRDAIRHAKKMVMIHSGLPHGFWGLWLHFLGCGVLLKEFLSAVKRQGIAIAFRRAYYGMRRIMVRYG